MYEGGLKVWEASLDLVEYLLTLGIGGIGRQIDSEDAIGSPFPSAGESAHTRAASERSSGECTESHLGKDASHAKGCLVRVLEVYQENRQGSKDLLRLVWKLHLLPS